MDSSTSLTLIISLLLSQVAVAADVLPFQIQTTVVRQELSPQFCWFHPRATAIPGFGKEGQPAVIMTIQKHLVVDDYYSGLWFMRTDDLGRTWSGPTEIPELAWRKEGDNVTLSVADVTPVWHVKTGKLIAWGIQVRYSDRGAQLQDRPRSHDFAYTVFDPQNGKWTTWRNLDNVPDPNDKTFTLAPGCVQSVINDDGTIFVPVYTGGPTSHHFRSTVLHLGFDGDKLTYLNHGDELSIDGGRGCYEPSLARYRDRFYLTLRTDTSAFLAVSDDGQKFGPITPWQFNDGLELGSYNTQAHWLVHSDGLFLSYTRRNADNDHIVRHRAPLFVAQVDPEKRQILRATEQIVLPERGVMLGNFGATAISPDESWITDSEFINNGQKHPRGADGTTWVGRVKWARPNKLVPVSGPPVKIITLGDSITKAVRTGVGPTETFSWMLAAELRARGINAEAVNVGIGGEQTDRALARLDKDVIAQQPTFVTIMYGTNDSYQYKGESAPRLTRTQYHDNLKQLIARLRTAGAIPILMTPPRWGKDAKNGVGGDPNILLTEYVLECREVSLEEKVPFVDHFQIWSAAELRGVDIGKWTTDLCHPNPEGQRILADSILPIVLQSLKQQVN